MISKKGMDAVLRANAVFSDEEVRKIRRLYATGQASRRKMAQFYGVGMETIARITRGDTYAWVKDDPMDALDGMENLRGLRVEGGGGIRQEEIAASQERLMGLLQGGGGGTPGMSEELQERVRQLSGDGAGPAFDE